MSGSAVAFFHELEQRGHEPLLDGTDGTVRFELVNGKRIDRWLVGLDKGNVAVKHGNGDYDCNVRAPLALFDGLVDGSVNAMAAVLRGAIQVDGDPELLFRFQRIFPGPPAKGGQRA